MATSTPVKTTTVKYLNKDFESFKRDLTRYAQAHFSGSFQDFNETSPGMAILEMQAYVADVLAFYMDQQFLEMKKETAKQLENVVAFAKMRGYKPKGKRAATTNLTFVLEIPAAGGVPDPRYLPVLKAGTQAGGPAGTVFELLDDINFANYDPANAVPAKVSPANQVISFAVAMRGLCIGARTVTDHISVGDFTSYRTVDLSSTDVIDIIDVFDEQGNQWFEVDYLAQNAVLDQIVNSSSDVDVVPYVLKYRSAARRFVLEKNLVSSLSYLQFGAADGLQYNDELIPSVSNLALPIEGKTTFNTRAIDPQNFVKTATMGLSPFNTTLTIRYRAGGGAETNVPVGSISRIITAYYGEFGDKFDQGWAAKTDAVRNSIECKNYEVSTGGGPAETIDEIKVNAESYFAAQDRAVTKDDYLAHIFSLPEKFGKIDKAFILPNKFNPFAVDIHVLCRDNNNLLVAPSPTLRQNIKTYFDKLRMVTEGIGIYNGCVINIGVNFGVVISPKFNRAEVMTKCLTTLKNYLNTDNMAIGQPLVLSDMQALIQNIPGIISVYNFRIVSHYGKNPDTGLTYNSSPLSFNFDVAANTKNGIVYCPTNAVFEVRYPDLDIIGEST